MQNHFRRSRFGRLATVMLAVLGFAAAGSTAELRLLSYNIHHGEGLDRRLDLERIAAFIKEQHPDVVALQEVDQACERTGKVRQADELARLTGYCAFFAPFMKFQGGEYGMAMLTRLPMLAERRVELPAGTEPRAAAVITVQTPGGPVTLADIHFYQTETQRLAQAQALATALAGLPHPVVWIGDFNSRPGDAVMRWLANEFSIPAKQGPTHTFPADRPRTEIDYVIFRPENAFAAKEYRVLEEAVMSDHRPVLAVLNLKAPRSAAAVQTIGFDDAPTNQPPPGWTIAISGEGTPDWRVVSDPTAPSAPCVLQQSGLVPRASFPLCLREGARLRNGFVEVKFMTVRGEVDQAAGVVWRAQDAANYYVCRANALEDNVVLYQLEEGKRKALDIVGRTGGYGVDVQVTPAVWHTLRVAFNGSRFQVSLDGQALFEVEDATFAAAGRVGLWTKADSVTVFDDFRMGTD